MEISWSSSDQCFPSSATKARFTYIASHQSHHNRISSGFNKFSAICALICAGVVIIATEFYQYSETTASLARLNFLGPAFQPFAEAAGTKNRKLVRNGCVNFRRVCVAGLRELNDVQAMSFI